MEKFKHFLSTVPGFRSKKKFNMLIASIYYIFCLTLFFKGMPPMLTLFAAPYLLSMLIQSFEN